MFFSKSDYFKQTSIVLNQKAKDVELYLELKGYNASEIAEYLLAYRYFMDYPTQYDGATIVKDLIDVHDLDLDAMLHDYEYLVLKAGHNFITKWKSDFKYGKGIERKGKSAYAAWSRFAGLTVTGILFVIKSYLKTL